MQTMNDFRQGTKDKQGAGKAERWFWMSISGVVVLLMLGVLLVPRERRPGGSDESSPARPRMQGSAPEAASGSGVSRRASWTGVPGQTPEAVVAEKVSRFADSRREIVYGMARHFNVEVPPDVERFFEVAASGNWEELHALFLVLKEQMRSDSRPRNLPMLWPAILETFGVAEQAHLWPAQRLLDYGNSILGALKPGMVYVGGTDPGRFIPTLLNETQGGERHMVLTQNALADRTYLDYLGFLYGDRCATLTSDDSQRAFADYLSDAQRRLRHDQEFPNEPRQVRSGEDIRITDGKVQVSGQLAVMAINERLVRTLMEKNPELSFGIEQSFAFTSMYGATAPLGPIMELGVRDQQHALTPERAAESVNYWRATAQEFASNLEAANSLELRKTYGKMAAEQASLLLHHRHTAAAEEAFRLATQIGPASPEAVIGYANLLAEQRRFAEAIPVVEVAMKMQTPQQQQFRDLIQQLKRSANQ